jgi:hypothetical protein
MLPPGPEPELGRSRMVYQVRGKRLAFRVVAATAWQAQGRLRRDGCRNQRSLCVASVRNLPQFAAEHGARRAGLVGR